jgi:electron transfer flavoprotein alpha subunit
MSTIVVLVEQSSGTPSPAGREALAAAAGAGGTPVAVLVGDGAADAAQKLGGSGASRAVVLTGHDKHSPDALAADLAAVVKDESAQAFVCAATSTGRDVAPRVAAHLDCTLFSDCTGFAAEGKGYRIVRPWLAGKLVATMQSQAPVTCVTVRRNVFNALEGQGSVEVSERARSVEPKAVLVGVAAKEGGKLDVSEAPVVVSGGRGLKEPANFSILEELAAAFGNAAVGASRAVVDAGWRPHADQVGQTGKTVSPQLYIAVGISGAIQHLAGMKTSKTIVAINKDKDAPIFKVADYGIVGDAFEVVPALTEAVRAARAAR